MDSSKPADRRRSLALRSARVTAAAIAISRSVDRRLRQRPRQRRHHAAASNGAAWSCQGSTIEIKGVNGDVDGEPGSGAEVEVRASRRGRPNNPEDVQYRGGRSTASGVTICAVYPSTGRGRPNECKPGEGGRMNVQNNDVTVRFTVSVPAGVRFAGKTVNGDIEPRRWHGAVSLATVNGSVNFSTSSYGDATTVNGSITRRDGRQRDGRGDLDFATVNGSITLDLPSDVSTDLRATTVNGEITTDFPLTVAGRVSRRSVERHDRRRRPRLLEP